jgi:thioesterase domain-containing protein
MTTREFLQKLRMQGVRVWADGDRLRVNAPQNALTAELQAALTARKLEIQSFLEAIAAKRSSLVPIQPSGSRPVFFGVPGPDGDVFCYLQLSRQLGPDQRFYAFEAPGVDGTQPPLTSIEALAGLYLRDLKVFQPDGPYYIGGFCLGGIVAFELARQLRAQGQDVALLALLESPSPNGLKPRHRAAGARWCRRDAIVARLRWLGTQPWSERLAFVQNRLTRVLRGCDPAAPGQPVRGWQEEQKDRVFRATLEAAYAYVLEARTYPGRIVLFLGSQGLRRSAYWRQLDWARVAAGGLEVNVGPAGCTDHLMMLRDPPRVLALAELLKPYLARPPRRPR